MTIAVPWQSPTELAFLLAIGLVGLVLAYNAQREFHNIEGGDPGTGSTIRLPF